jgi:hypothetical protein
MSAWMTSNQAQNSHQKIVKVSSVKLDLSDDTVDYAVKKLGLTLREIEAIDKGGDYQFVLKPPKTVNVNQLREKISNIESPKVIIVYTTPWDSRGYFDVTKEIVALVQSLRMVHKVQPKLLDLTPIREIDVPVGKFYWKNRMRYMRYNNKTTTRVKGDGSKLRSYTISEFDTIDSIEN